MPPLTAAALVSHQELYTQQQANIADSYAATVVRQEQLHEYYSHLGVLQGHHHIPIGEHSAAAEPHHREQRRNGTNPNNGSNTDRSSNNLHNDEHFTTTAAAAAADAASSLSLSSFMPPHRPQDSYLSNTADTPLERFLTLGACNDPSYISRPAMAQAGYYGRMESADARNLQVQASAARVVERAGARRGSSPDSMKYM